MTRRRTRRDSSARELVAAAAVMFALGAFALWIARWEVTPVWLAAGIGFAAGIVATVGWQRWVARAAYRLGYVKVRGRH
ncbi:hypothetical protein ACIBKY_51970 [Nonomuraea sp. NPDC050394]|uniref:hypothetical protein n=1 Tax=Nonomuraea sp. NPDC050394 TaxID=3364363 RepID=UPI0037B5A361